MLFNSIEFLVFLPVVFLLYWDCGSQLCLLRMVGLALPVPYRIHIALQLL